MRTRFDMDAITAALKAIANLIRGLTFAAENINIQLDSLRFVSDSLLDRASELESLIRDALDQRIAECVEREAALTAVKDEQERDPSGSPGDMEQAEAPRALLASWAKMAGRQAKECSGASAGTIVVMAANLREAPK